MSTVDPFAAARAWRARYGAGSTLDQEEERRRREEEEKRRLEERKRLARERIQALNPDDEVDDVRQALRETGGPAPDRSWSDAAGGAAASVADTLGAGFDQVVQRAAAPERLLRGDGLAALEPLLHDPLVDRLLGAYGHPVPQPERGRPTRTAAAANLVPPVPLLPLASQPVMGAIARGQEAPLLERAAFGTLGGNPLRTIPGFLEGLRSGWEQTQRRAGAGVAGLVDPSFPAEMEEFAPAEHETVGGRFAREHEMEPEAGHALDLAGELVIPSLLHGLGKPGRRPVATAEPGAPPPVEPLVDPEPGPSSPIVDSFVDAMPPGADSAGDAMQMTAQRLLPAGEPPAPFGGQYLADHQGVRYDPEAVARWMDLGNQAADRAGGELLHQRLAEQVARNPLLPAGEPPAPAGGQYLGGYEGLRLDPVQARAAAEAAGGTDAFPLEAEPVLDAQRPLGLPAGRQPAGALPPGPETGWTMGRGMAAPEPWQAPEPLGLPAGSEDYYIHPDDVGRPELPAGPAIQEALPPASYADHPAPARATRTYDEVQAAIDSAEDAIEAGGVDPVKLLLTPEKMPAELRALYDERDAIGATELQGNVRDVSEALRARGASDGEVAAALKSIALDPADHGALAQGMAGMHTSGLARSAGLLDDMTDRFARVRGETGRASPETRAAAAKAVRVIRDYFHPLSELDTPSGPRIKTVVARPVAPAPRLLPVGDGATPTGIYGSETHAKGPATGRRYGFRHRLMELADLKVNEKGAQPRDRTGRKSSAAQVSDIAQKLDPEELTFDARDLSRGTPIVDPEGVVESGNGRTMAMREAASRKLPGWDAYRQGLPEALRAAGIDPAAAEGMREPVLVRERVDQLNPKERLAFLDEANQGVAAKLSPAERGRLDAARMSPEVIANLQVSETAPLDVSLRAAGNRDAVRQFLGGVSKNDLAELVDAQGALSPAGGRRMKAAILSRVYGGEAGARVAEAMGETGDVGRNITTAVEGNLPKMARLQAAIEAGALEPELAIGEDLARAVETFSRLRSEGTLVSDFLKQGDMFGGELTPEQARLLETLDATTRSSKELRQALDRYVGMAEAAGDPRQASMFGDIRPTKLDLLDAALRRPAQDAMFKQASPLDQLRAAFKGNEEGYIRPSSDQLTRERDAFKRELLAYGRQSARRSFFERARTVYEAHTAADMAEFMRSIDSTLDAATADKLATAVFASLGRSRDGFNVGQAVKDEGGTPREAQAQIDLINKTDGRDLRKTPLQAEADKANGGKPASDPLSPGVPPPGAALPQGEAGARILQAEGDIKPGLARGLISDFFWTMAGDLVRTVPGQKLVAAVRAVERGTNLLRQTARAGGNKAAAALGWSESTPGLNAVWDAIPKQYRNEKWIAWYEGPEAPKGMRLEDLVPDAKERAAMDADAGMQESAKLFKAITDEEARVTGLKNPRERYFRHFLDRDAYIKALTEKRAALEAGPATKARHDAIASIDTALAEARSRADRVLLSDTVNVPAAMRYGFHKSRSANAPYYITDLGRAFDMYADSLARKIAYDKFAPDLQASARELRPGSIVERSGSNGKGVKVSPEYAATADMYIKNAFGLKDRTTMRNDGIASLADSFLDVPDATAMRKRLNDGIQAISTEEARYHVQSFLKYVGYKAFIDYNPQFLLNALQNYTHAAPMLGERYYLEAVARVASDYARRGLSKLGVNAGRDPLVRATMDDLGLSIIDSRPYSDSTGAAGAGTSRFSQAQRFLDKNLPQVFSRSELFNHQVAGVGRAAQFRDLAKIAAKAKAELKGAGGRAALEKLTLERAMKSKLHEPARPILKDNLYTPEEQVRAAVDAVEDGTVPQAGSREAQKFIDTAIFHYGRSERPWGVVQHASADLPLQFSSYFGKTFDLVKDRMSPTAKVRFILYPLLVGGAKAIPGLAQAAAHWPGFNKFIDDLEEGKVGGEQSNLLRHVMRFNLARQLDVQVPNNATPLGKFVPGLAPDFINARTGWGKAATVAARLYGPAVSAAVNAVAPVAEAGALAGAGPAGLQAKESLPRVIPILKNAQFAGWLPEKLAGPGEPGLELAQKAKALLGLRPAEREKMFGRDASLEAASEMEQVRKHYLAPYLFATNAGFHAYADGMKWNPKQTQAWIEGRGTAPDMRAFKDLPVSLALDKGHEHFKSMVAAARNGDQAATAMGIGIAGVHLEKLRDLQQYTKTPQERARLHEAILETQKLSRELGFPLNARRTPVNMALPPGPRLENIVRHAPPGEPLAAYIKKRAMKMRPDFRERILNELNAHERQEGIETYRKNLQEGPQR